MYKILFAFEYGYGDERKIFPKIYLISSLNVENVSWHLAKLSSPSSSAKAPSERLCSSRFGTSRLRDFHSIEFRPADIPVWPLASRERLLRAPRPLRLPHCLGCFAACGFAHPPALRDADYRIAPVIVLPLWFFVFIVVVVRMLRMDFNQEGSAGMVVILLFVFLYYMGRRQNS